MPGSQLMPASGGRALGVSGAHGAGCGRARCGLREGALVQLELMVLGSAFAHGARCGALAEVWGRKTATPVTKPIAERDNSVRGLSVWFGHSSRRCCGFTKVASLDFVSQRVLLWVRVATFGAATYGTMPSAKRIAGFRPRRTWR